METIINFMVEHPIWTGVIAWLVFGLFVVLWIFWEAHNAPFDYEIWPDYREEEK